MKILLLILGFSLVGFITGFLLAAWVRQPDVEQSRVELELCRDREQRLQKLVDELKRDMRDMALDLSRRVS
jgi:hypothetical protein